MQDVEVKRLAFIRYLYKVGIEQSYQPEPLNAISLLSFHDAAELFLQMASEHLDVTKDVQKFMEYWDAINRKMDSDQLAQKDSMRRLNKARVQLKHNGTAPSKLDLEAFRATITNFLQENTTKVFDVDFDSISLVDLVAYDGAKSKLRSAQDLMQNGDPKRAIQTIAESFELLIHEYEQKTRTEFGKSPFFFGRQLTFETSFFMKVEGKMKPFVDKVQESITSMQTAIKILSFGFDYRKYSKFDLLTPIVLRDDNETLTATPSDQITLEDCKFCFDYVIECALKLQDFDYNM